MVWLDEKFGGSQITSESFSTAGRSIKMGLTACDIVSKWTWAATLLQSSNVAWQYGVSGPFWYASGEFRGATWRGSYRVSAAPHARMAVASLTNRILRISHAVHY